jgi:hypothetical protein
MTDAASSSLHGIAKPHMGNPMTSQLTQLRAQQHIAYLQREADYSRRAATSDAKPAKPRRTSARPRWIFLPLVPNRRRV